MFNISKQKTITAFLNQEFELVINEYDGEGNVSRITIGRTHINNFIKGLIEEVKDLNNE